jgi:DNA-binding SARP family transcriptional activator
MIGQETDHPPVDAPTLRFRVVGGFEATLGDRRLTRADWQRVSAERLVKLLLATPGHRLSREVVAETLWPGADPDTSRPNLRKALHFANLALQGTGAIAAADGWAALDPARIDVDLDRLNAALDVLASPADGGDGTLDHAMATVLDLGSSDLLPDDGFEDWLAAPRERLRARWQRVALGAARRAQVDGRGDAALELVGQLLERDPTDEAAHRIAIQVYAAEGRHHAARRQFELCRRALRDGLDADPSAETIEAFRAAERTATTSPGRATAEARLVARKRELELVEPLLDRVADGGLASLVIRGPAGIGKTRLLREVELYARAAGWRVLEWRATGQAATLAYAPVRTSLSREVTAEEVGGWPEPSRSALATLVPELAMDGRLPNAPGRPPRLPAPTPGSSGFPIATATSRPRAQSSRRGSCGCRRTRPRPERACAATSDGAWRGSGSRPRRSSSCRTRQRSSWRKEIATRR